MLKFTNLMNTRMATVYGTVEIDKEGIVHGLTAEQEKEFKDISGFEYQESKSNKTEDKAPAKEKSDKVEVPGLEEPVEKPEPKETPKVEEKKPARKTTARKTTQNK